MPTLHRKRRRFQLLILFMLTAAVSAAGQRLLADLSGTWKFDIGDDPRRAQPSFDDRSWDDVRVPSSWEDQGFPGYDGYGWYRTHMTVPSAWKDKELYLSLGQIDDVDEVYVNGHFIGFNGSFPPRYVTAYGIQRIYRLPWWALQPGGDNVIAVRVYDDEQAGGIIDGEVGLYERRPVARPDIPLPAVWKFRTGDNGSWSDPSFDDRTWESVHVPAWWETQGHREYDGYAWYRVRFELPSVLPEGPLYLLAGRIDDFDETYLNGVRIGRTGVMPTSPHRFAMTSEYEQLRAYRIPNGLLHPGQSNVLAIRVYDGFRHGGMYDGPIGIVSRDQYNEIRKSGDDSPDWFDRLMNRIFRDR